MSETTINQRLNFLLKTIGMKPGAFARALDLSETTVRNYVDRSAKPSSEVLERIANTFKQVNLVWLITGNGEHFLPNSTPSSGSHHISTKNFQGNVSGPNHGTITQSVGHFKPKGNSDAPLPENMVMLSTDAHEAMLREIELLKSQLHDKERTIQILLNQAPKP
jgi:hypothetical protein